MDRNRNGSIQSLADLSTDLLDDVHSNFYNRVLDALRAGSDINAANGDNRETYLHVAVKTGNEKAVRTLLACGANPNLYAGEYDCALKKYDIVTPLHQAVKLRFLRIVVLLLQYGAKPDGYTMHGFTALHLAVQSDCLPVLQEILMASNVDAVAKSYDFLGWSALHFATHLDKIYTIKMLLDNNANIALKNDAGMVPLQLMKSMNALEVVITHPRFLNKEKELVRHLCTVEVNFNEKPTPDAKSLFLMANEYGFTSFAKYMEECGARQENNLQWDLNLLHKSLEDQLQI